MDGEIEIIEQETVSERRNQALVKQDPVWMTIAAAFHVITVGENMLASSYRAAPAAQTFVLRGGSLGAWFHESTIPRANFPCAEAGSGCDGSIAGARATMTCASI